MAQMVSFKSWRAGKATELVKSGLNVGEVLQAGEWSGGSFLRYAQVELLDPNVFDEEKILNQVLDDSDEENERSQATEG